MTIVEKILARAAGKERVGPGDLVIVDVDTIVMIDVNFVSTLRRNILKVSDPDRIAVILDHFVPAPDLRAAEAHIFARRFVERFNIKRFHDVGPHQGISHAVAAENAYALPGSVLVCSDSHTCSAGAFNCAARGIGHPDMLFAVTTGKTWFKLGETLRYDLVGGLPIGVAAKDLFLHIAAAYGDHTNQNLEFGGSGLATLSVDARRTIATMGAELSAEFVTFEPDATLIDYLGARHAAPFEPQYPDAAAVYAAHRTLELSKLRPMVALPDAVIGNSVPVEDVVGTRINQAFVGSCANGTLEDLAEVARVLTGRRVDPKVRMIVTPSSQAIFRAATDAGYIKTIAEAGAVVTSSSCGACFGGHMGVLGPSEICVTSSTRNFKGRMGDPTARIYMASSATVAASAVAGRLISERALGAAA